MKDLAMVIVEARKHFQQRAIEWWSAGLMTSWGFAVLADPMMFSHNPGFVGMLRLAPQHVWGLVVLMSGMARLVGLTINGFWTRSPIIRWATSMIAIFVWFCVAVGMFYAPWFSVGVVVYTWHMFADMYSAFRASRDYMVAGGEMTRAAIQTGVDQNVHELRQRG